MNKTLLLISTREDDRAFAQEVAATADLSLQIVNTARDAGPFIAGEMAQVIFADTSTAELYKNLENVVQSTVGLFSDKINANAIHFLSSQELQQVQFLIQSPLFGHFIQRVYDDPKEAGQHYGRIVRATQADRAFGIAPLLKPGAKTQVVRIELSTQKQQAVESVKSYLLAAKFQSRMATVIANAVDELLMNAIFDAPVDNFGKPLHSAVSRATAMKLDGKNTVEMHVGYDGTYVAITAVDLYGSIDKNKLMSHISKIYTKEEYRVKTSVAGAGIGLATVFHSGGSFFFVSEAQSRTEVTVFFKRTESFREFKKQFHFISTQFYF